MEIYKNPINLINSSNAYIRFLEEQKCPKCKASISPTYLSAAIYGAVGEYGCCTVFNYCTNCNSTFLTNYKGYITDSSRLTISEPELINSEPNYFLEREFEENLTDLSPQFCVIYNQALAAESSGLSEIAGIGYRKALEFLIKDFSIEEHPDDIDKIKSMPLAACIKNYIDDIRIKTLAEKSVWLGNDETHYIRKHEDRDITDMKNFIKAAEYFISMVLITKDASTITPK